MRCPAVQLTFPDLIVQQIATSPRCFIFKATTARGRSAMRAEFALQEGRAAQNLLRDLEAVGLEVVRAAPAPAC